MTSTTSNNKPKGDTVVEIRDNIQKYIVVVVRHVSKWQKHNITCTTCKNKPKDGNDVVRNATVGQNTMLSM